MRYSYYHRMAYPFLSYIGLYFAKCFSWHPAHPSRTITGARFSASLLWMISKEFFSSSSSLGLSLSGKWTEYLKGGSAITGRSVARRLDQLQYLVLLFEFTCWCHKGGSILVKWNRTTRPRNFKSWTHYLVIRIHGNFFIVILLDEVYLFMLLILIYSLRTLVSKYSLKSSWKFD